MRRKAGARDRPGLRHRLRPPRGHAQRPRSKRAKRLISTFSPVWAARLGPQLLDRLVAVADVRLLEQARRSRTTCRACPGRSGRAPSRACRRPGPGRCRSPPPRGPAGTSSRLTQRVSGMRRDLQGDLVGELAEPVRVGHEVGLAADLDEHADAAVAVDVGVDDALVVVRSAALGGLGDAALAQQLDRGVDVAAGLDEGALAVHQAGARALADVLDLGRRGCRWRSCRLVSAAGAAVSLGARGLGAAWAAGLARPRPRPRAALRRQPASAARGLLGRAGSRALELDRGHAAPAFGDAVGDDADDHDCRSGSRRRCPGSRSRPRRGRSSCPRAR